MVIRLRQCMLSRTPRLPCPCGKATESRTHIVGECEVYKEERDVLEEDTREIDECDMEEFDTLL